MEEKVNLFDFIQNRISCYDEEYANELGIYDLDDLDDEDINNIVAEVLNNQDIEDLIHEEIEQYYRFKKEGI